MPINVKDPQFGALGDGSVDDAPAIQRAIDFAKTRQANPFAAYVATVYFPAGYYLINSPINLTGANGIWLVGDGGSYLNTIILGNTGSRPMFDFSGSSQSGCENFTFLPSSASNPSTFAIQFALTSTGGLNCGVRHCYIQMNDAPTANGGLGSIGLLNVRSEEFYIHECLFRANSPLVMSYKSNIVYTGVNYTATSNFQTVTGGSGSMGVTSINGTSLQCLERRQPAMVLVGTNSLNFQGYLGRLSASIGTNETAILCVDTTGNLRVHATMESFSRILQIRNTGFGNSELNIIAANMTSPTTDLIDVTDCVVAGLKARIALSIPAEQSNRIVMYHAPASGGNQPSAGYLTNCEITCFDIQGNQFIVSQNLLKRSINTTFYTSRPFEKRSGRIRQLTNNLVSAGTVGAPATVTIFQFRQANQQAFTGINGGYYRIKIDGVIRGGGIGSGATATLCFQAQIVVNQLNTGVFDAPEASVVVLDECRTNPSYITITNVLFNISFANGIGTVTMTPQAIGSGTAEGLNYDGFAEIQSDFYVNDPIPL